MLRMLCAAVAAFSLIGAAQAHGLVGACLPANYGNAGTKSYEAYSDDFGNYTEFRGVQYGVSQKGEGYVGVNSAHVLVSEIQFRDPKGKKIALRSDELALSRAVAYVSKANRSVVCVLSPFSGLGSSGSFQGVAALIAVQKPVRAQRLRVAGAVVRVH